MRGDESFVLHFWDWIAFFAFFGILSGIGYWAGRKERAGATEYFLAGKRLPWYVVGGSFVASNISTEHFIGMIGVAVIYGICVAMSEWTNVLTFSLLIWFFIPFLLASKVFTTPEFLEKRFHPILRQIFAIVTMISNIVAFLAAVLYGGALAIQSLFQMELTRLTNLLPASVVPPGTDVVQLQIWISIVVLGIVAGVWAIYGGLSSVAWTDLFTVLVMVLGGMMVTWLGLHALAGDQGSLLDGMATLIERNQAMHGPWRAAVDATIDNLPGTDTYNRLSVIQPASHPTHPWPALIFSVFSVSIWYNVLNQFMIQRVLGARNSYHARMGIVFAGFLKVLLPAIVVLPGLIVFAMHPEILMNRPWSDVKPSADKGYVQLIQTLVPIGFRGLFLAALFGAIQSTVNSVLNSTATIFTLDIYQRWIHRRASDKHLVKVGILSSVVVLGIAIGLGGFIGRIGGNLFVYIQTLYAFFAPPFSALFLLGVLWKRINAPGAIATVILGFTFGIAVKVYVQFDTAIQKSIPMLPFHPVWLEPYANQAALNWVFCMLVCISVSCLTTPPRPEQVSDQLTFRWQKMNILDHLGNHWYSSVVTWWLLFVFSIASLLILFSGYILPMVAP
ncbi:MAG: sodium/solute symporter [Pirellulales bacterium]|nr:sodium/solute symporter [Pirellulales bacterium]